MKHMYNVESVPLFSYPQDFARLAKKLRCSLTQFHVQLILAPIFIPITPKKGLISKVYYPHLTLQCFSIANYNLPSFNIARKNNPFTGDVPITVAIFHGWTPQL